MFICVQGQCRESEFAYEEASRVRQEMAEQASLAERRANALQGEMEEARALLDSAERGKRHTEDELSESRNAVNEMTTVNGRANAEKRRLEGSVHTMQAEIDDMLHQAKSSEEKAKKAMVDAARLADELRAEQDHVNTQAKAKQALESQMGELESRFQAANENAMRGGRAAMAKLESRIRELEVRTIKDYLNKAYSVTLNTIDDLHELEPLIAVSWFTCNVLSTEKNPRSVYTKIRHFQVELSNVQGRTGESMKGHQRAERKIKEIQFQNDEDRKNQERMSDLATKLQSKVR